MISFAKIIYKIWLVIINCNTRLDKCVSAGSFFLSSIESVDYRKCFIVNEVQTILAHNSRFLIGSMLSSWEVSLYHKT